MWKGFWRVLLHLTPLLAKTPLVIPQKSARPREAGLRDACALEILRYAQDDTAPACHPERSEESVAPSRSADLAQVTLCTSGESPVPVLR